jgi:glutathione synthase/RimK-type ligase-like ATP-grasp enzyme
VTAAGAPGIHPAIVLATSAGHPDGMADTPGLVSALTRAGAAPALVRWDDPAFPWSDADLVVLHAPWDYTARLPEFLTWIRHVVRVSALVNSRRLVEWNASKAYLAELAAAGVEVPPLRLFPHGRSVPADAVGALGAGELVVKPAVGAGGRRAMRQHSAADAVAYAAAEFPDEAVVVQAYVPEVGTGELSAVSLGGQVSHLVRKIPAEGEFRIHERYGGHTHAEPVTADLEAYVGSVLRALPEPPACARVDFVETAAGTRLLMEVEVIEPHLYLTHHPPSFDRFAQLLRALARPGSAG